MGSSDGRWFPLAEPSGVQGSKSSRKENRVQIQDETSPRFMCTVKTCSFLMAPVSSEQDSSFSSLSLLLLLSLSFSYTIIQFGSFTTSHSLIPLSTHTQCAFLQKSHRPIRTRFAKIPPPHNCAKL